MAEIQRFIIRMLALDKEERDRRAKEKKPFERIRVPMIAIPIKLHYSIDTAQRRLDIKDLPIGIRRFSDQQEALIYVHRFLRTINLRPTFAEEPGVTWLELLVAFEFHGGRLETPIAERSLADRARPAYTTRQLLGLFVYL